MKKLILASGLTILTALTLLTVFGDNLRALRGMSASALAGENSVTHHKNAALEAKRLPNFSNAPSAPSFVALTPNRAVTADSDRFSTFAIDVDTASWTYASRVMHEGRRPEPGGVRVEEWVNAFHYDLDAPTDEPFAIHLEGARTDDKVLLKVALQGRQLANADRKPAHLVFLVDTSGSMDSADRLPLAQQSLELLVDHLNARDTVAIATYAGDTRVVLEPTPASERALIHAAINSLRSGGGTAMGSGLELAYSMAVRHVRPGEVSRVIVLTDGDANLGRNLSGEEMLSAVKGHVSEGVTLTTAGFGMGNYRAAQLEALVDKGDGQALYVDSINAARKVFVDGLAGTIEHIARDVKVQVEFDQSAIATWKLVGYENRAVAEQDFRNDSVDGGELGAGHSVTALYEVTLKPGRTALGLVTVRGLHPDTRRPFETSRALDTATLAPSLDQASPDLRFATAVAFAADTLRGNSRDEWPLERLVALARSATKGVTERLEFVALLDSIRDAKTTIAHVDRFEGY